MKIKLIGTSAQLTKILTRIENNLGIPNSTTSTYSTIKDFDGSKSYMTAYETHTNGYDGSGMVLDEVLAANTVVWVTNEQFVNLRSVVAVPDASSLKSEIQSYMDSESIPYNSSDTKPELLEKITLFFS